MSAIPAHVVLSLIEQGVMFADAMSRNARMGYCRSCRAVVVRGLDHDRVAEGVVVDPCPLSALGELGAGFTGRDTYELSAKGAYGYEINPRGPEEITGAPAGRTCGDVVARHVCGSSPLASIASHIRAIPRPSQGDNTWQTPF